MVYSMQSTSTISNQNRFVEYTTKAEAHHRIEIARFSPLLSTATFFDLTRRYKPDATLFTSLMKAAHLSQRVAVRLKTLHPQKKLNHRVIIQFIPAGVLL